MHGKETPETVREAKQTLQMGCDIYRRSHPSLARHDKRHNIHLSLRISNGYPSTSDWKLTAVHSASDQNKPRSSAACKNTKEGRVDTARPVGISDNASGPRGGGRGRSAEKRGSSALRISPQELVPHSSRLFSRLIE